MAQFTVYRNQNPETRQRVPFLLDVQNDLLSDLRTRVVLPLYDAATMQNRIVRTLTPTFEIEGRPHVAVTQELASIPRAALGGAVVDLSSRRSEIVAALDLLITGI